MASNMDASVLLDHLFLRRIGYDLVAPRVARDPFGYEIRVDKAVGRYRKNAATKPSTTLPDNQELWFRLASMTSALSYQKLVEGMRSSWHRKTYGMHQTPSNLARFVVDRIVNYLDASTGFSKSIACDPACGSGVFLVQWLERVVERAGSRAPQVAVEIFREERLLGYDTDELALYSADLALREILLRKAGVPAQELRDMSMPVFCRDWLGQNRSEERFDVIMGNPPYVRTQNLSPALRRSLSQSSPILVGRFDLSLAFLEVALDRLGPRGVLGFVLSNKLLSANYARKVRLLLADQRLVREIHDLGDSHVFGAAVLPMVLVLQRDIQAKPEIFAYSEWKAGRFSRNTRVTESMTYAARDYGCLSRELWSFGGSGDNQILDKIEDVCPERLGLYAERICVGIKTTANDVFADPITEEFLRQHGDLREIAHPAIRGINIKRWHVMWTGKKAKEDTYLLYPYTEVEGKRVLILWNRLPDGARSWFLSNSESLKNRYYIREAGRGWYEIWVPQQLSLFVGLKIVVPDISDHNRFALDEDGYFCLDSAYTIKLGSGVARDEYLFLLAWLNSSPIESYFKARLKNALYGKRLRYMKSNLCEIPVLPFKEADAGVRKAMAHNADSAIKAVASGRDPSDYELEINCLVRKLVSEG